MNHSHCPHPATKAARALCRKMRASQEATLRLTKQSIRDAYYIDGAEVDDILGMISQAGLTFDYDADIEDIIASL